MVKVQLELAQVKADIDRRIYEKEEEFEISRSDSGSCSCSERKRRRRRRKKLYLAQLLTDTVVLRKTHHRAVESLQASLEVKAKGQALRLKKKIESDLNEIEIQLDHANKNNSELVKTLKRLQQQIKVKHTHTTSGFFTHDGWNSQTDISL